MSLKQSLTCMVKCVLPGPIRYRILTVYYFMVDKIDFVLGRCEPFTPSRGLLRIATSPNTDFKESGQAFLRFLIDRCELKPHEKVLDVGCGVGRIAAALTGFLNSEGRYEGFDIVQKEIDWCEKNISSSYHNVRFRLANVYNLTYNPKGTMLASEYRFPFGDGLFDLVILASVFTHMLAPDMEHYIAEISRVLKPGGRCAISFYLLNDESKKNIDAGSSLFSFKHKVDGCMAQDGRNPEIAIAYAEESVRCLFEKHRLRIREPILYGTWSRTKQQTQDIIIASRTEDKE
jgi:ubiquinone/menaquinone biosynthesis C-methylase UbiE